MDQEARPNLTIASLLREMYYNPIFTSTIQPPAQGLHATANLVLTSKADFDTTIRRLLTNFMPQFLAFVAVGFFAQVIDGALGMAYGVSATTFLLAIGLSPAAASASVHVAMLITTAMSGLSHLGFGNVDKNLFKRLVIPGALGAVAGAFLLTRLPGEAIKPWIAGYLLLMGLFILLKALRNIAPAHVTSHLFPLGIAGGFLSAFGGGGWGPIVVSTLVARGNNPRMTIGSANLAEFFVALASSITFVLAIGQELQKTLSAIAGLAIGGAIAAPLAAFLTSRINGRVLMFIVGVLIIILSLRTVLLAIF